MINLSIAAMASRVSIQRNGLLEIPSPRWGSRPPPQRPRHALQIQRCLLYGTKREEKGSPYNWKHWTWGRATREELLRRLKFPRKDEPLISKIWWTMKWTPQLLRTVIICALLYPFRHRQPPEQGVVVKSRIGRFFFNFVAQDEVVSVLRTTFQPWGLFAFCDGPSMEPTFSSNPAVAYSSYAYTNSEDVKVGDVVVVVRPGSDAEGPHWIKRVAALGGKRVCLTQRIYGTRFIFLVKFSLTLLH